MNRSRAGRRTEGTSTVHLHVRDAAQLFNSSDPSPFWDRSLDRDAAACIEEEFAARPTRASWHLAVHVREGDLAPRDLQVALENYYSRLADSARRGMTEHFRSARLAFAAGVLAFAAFMGLRQLLQQLLVSGVPRALDEGCILLAWLALWRPAEYLAFEWMPLDRKRRLYQRLAGIQVVVQRAA